MNQSTDRRELYVLLGDVPPRERAVSGKIEREQDLNGMTIQTLLLDLNGLEPVPAYFVKPAGSGGRLPTVLFNHSHGGQYDVGKREFLGGREYMTTPPYAQDLVWRGYAALCIDHWCFGGRAGQTESATFKRMLWEGRVLWGMMVYDSIKAVEYLCGRDDVDADRIATLGMSMGSTMAWWLAALDERIKVCIDICCLADFQALIDADRLDLHGVYYFVPSLLKHFTTARINALIAPRPHLALAGRSDVLTPIDGLERIDAELRRVYAEQGSADAWKLQLYEVAHQETPQMRGDALGWLERWL